MRYVLAAALAAVAFVASAASAHANGRFPESNALFFSPSDPDLALLRTTFGEVVSHDHGKTWDWICERSIGLAGVEDPMYAITTDGTLISSTFQGLAISHDRACNFAFAGAALTELVFIDLTSRPATPGTVIAFASSYAGQDDAGAIFFKSTLFETPDEGKTFTALGASFDPTLLGETVDVAPSDADRIYVSAVRNPGTSASAALLTSKDHGKTYEEFPIALVVPERAAFIAAVDPTNADRLYVRTSNAVDKPSRVLLSDDAGKSFRVIFTGTGALPGFALSDDGKTIYVGGGKDGLNVASTTDFAFTQRSKLEISCLKFNKDALWACSTEKSGFVVGASSDNGLTFTPVLHFCDIRGPLACAVGSTTHTECTLGGTSTSRTPPWPVQRAVLGCGGPVLPEGGADGGASEAGTAPGGGGDAGGCSVRTPSPAPFAAIIAGAVALMALMRRRRR